MISVLDRTDRARYYHWCADLALAGEDYKVNEIVCFVHDESAPLSDFVQIKKYDMGFLLILLYTENQMLITECMDYVMFTDQPKNHCPTLHFHRFAV